MYQGTPVLIESPAVHSLERTIKKTDYSEVVESEKVSDSGSAKLAFEISEKIQNDMTYPGQVKVTVIRETRAVSIAK